MCIWERVRGQVWGYKITWQRAGLLFCLSLTPGLSFLIRKMWEIPPTLQSCYKDEGCLSAVIIVVIMETSRLGWHSQAATSWKSRSCLCIIHHTLTWLLYNIQPEYLRSVSCFICDSEPDHRITSSAVQQTDFFFFQKMSICLCQGLRFLKYLVEIWMEEGSGGCLEISQLDY